VVVFDVCFLFKMVFYDTYVRRTLNPSIKFFNNFFRSLVIVNFIEVNSVVHQNITSMNAFSSKEGSTLKDLGDDDIALGPHFEVNRSQICTLKCGSSAISSSPRYSRFNKNLPCGPHGPLSS